MSCNECSNQTGDPIDCICDNCSDVIKYLEELHAKDAEVSIRVDLAIADRFTGICTWHHGTLSCNCVYNGNSEFIVRNNGKAVISFSHHYVTAINVYSKTIILNINKEKKGD